MLLDGWRAELMYGEEEVLVAARHLVNGTTIRIVPQPRVNYHHIMCTGHEIIEAEGAPCESFHPGDYILMSDPHIRAELLTLFPEFDTASGSQPPLTARTVLRGAEARALASQEPPLALAA